MENDYEKTDRLFELHLKYLQKVQKIEKEIELEKQSLEAIDETDEQQFYLDRLEAGLFTLQLVDLVIAFVCNSSKGEIKSRLELLLSQQSLTFHNVSAIVKEYAKNIGDSEETKMEAKQIEDLASRLTESH